MRKTIPLKKGRKLESTRDLASKMLLDAGCIVKEVKIYDQHARIEAKKNLRNGRLHINISFVRGKLILDVHFDPT